MKTEHAIESAREQATTERSGGRPTPRYLDAMRNLLGLLERNWTPCEACDTGRARCVTELGERQVAVICRGCSARHSGSPVKRKGLRLAIAQRSGR